MSALALRDVRISDWDFGAGTIVGEIEIDPPKRSEKRSSASAKRWADKSNELLHHYYSNASLVNLVGLSPKINSSTWLELLDTADVKSSDQWMRGFLLGGALVGHPREDLRRVFRRIHGSPRLTLFLLEAMSFLPTPVQPYSLASGEEVLDVLLERGRLSCIFDETYFQLLSDVQGQIEHRVLQGDDYTLENVREAIKQKVSELKQ